MLDSTLGELARSRIVSRLEALDAAFNVEMTTASAIVADAARVDAVRTRYLQQRVELIWQAVKEVVTAGRIRYSAALEADLKAEIRKYAAPADARAGISVAGRLERPLKQADSDIDLFVLELKQHTGSQLPTPQSCPSPSATGPNTVIFQGPVGAVQTGPHATAHIQQRGPEEIQRPWRAARRDALISVGDVSFATDAEYYLGPQIYRRYSRHPMIGGDHVTQDFGSAPSQEPVRLRSGNQALETATMHRLQEFSMLRRAALPVTDYLDNEYTALVVRFTPKSAAAGLWTYEMELVVTSLIKLRGAPYRDVPGG